MNLHRTSLITLVALVILVITPAAVAEVYKCDGPDGPIYSDKKCGSDAANVELLDSSGVTGMSEQDKNYLAEKKLEREQEREAARSRKQQSSVEQSSVVDNQGNVYITENPGPWVQGQNPPRDRVNIKNLPAKPPSDTIPAKPRPVTLPAKPRKKG